MGCIPYSTLKKSHNGRTKGNPPKRDVHLSARLCSTGPARGKIWPINQAPAAWTKGSREQVRLWRGQLLLLGAARCQPQRVGQELGSWWPGKLLRGGMQWLRRPIVHPISHPGLGDTIVQACCLAGPTRVRPPSTTNVLQLEDQQVPGWDHPSDAWHQMAGSSLGSAGEGRGQAKGPSPLFVSFLSHSLPPSHILSSQHPDAPKMVKGALQPQSQLGYSHAQPPASLVIWSSALTGRCEQEEAPKPCMGGCTQQWPHSLGSP